MNGEKNAASIMSDLVQRFQEAAKTDDVDLVKSLHKEFPTLPVDIITAFKCSNPLLIACEHGSCAAAKAMIPLRPVLADIKNEHGSTAMHTLSEKGYADIVCLLGGLNPQSCLVEDNFSMIPLHIAATNGFSDVIMELVTICPSSLEKQTSDGETAHHLAVRNSQFEAFEVLVNLTKIHEKEQLLNTKDNEGNNLLHLATSNKLIEIVKLLLLDQSSECRTMIRVNSINNLGQTPLQVCNANSQDTIFNEIGGIGIIQAAAGQQTHDFINNLGQTPLQVCKANSQDTIFNENGRIIQAAAGQQTHDFLGQQSPQHPADVSITNGWNLASLSMEARNVLLMVLGIFAAAFFTVTCNLPAPFLNEDSLAVKTFHVKDVISCGLPRVVYPMIFNSAGFMTTMAAIVVLVWPLHLKTILLFLVICTCILYIILVDGIMPKFFVRFWKFRISSIALTWSFVLAVLVSGLGMAKCARPFWLFIHWLWTKRTTRCINTPEDFNV